MLSARTRYLRRKVAEAFLPLDEWPVDGNGTGPRPADPLRWLLAPLDRALNQRVMAFDLATVHRP